MSYIHQLCTFYLDGLHFGVDVKYVQEVTCQQVMTTVPLASPFVRGLMNLRGQIVTAIDMRRRLERPDRTTDEEPMNVVICTKDGLVSLIVDEIGDVVEVDDRAYERPPETLRGAARELIQGAYNLNGRLLLLLNSDRAVNIA